VVSSRLLHHRGILGALRENAVEFNTWEIDSFKNLLYFTNTI